MRVVHVAEVTLGGVGAYLEEIADYQSQVFGSSSVLFVVPKGSDARLPRIDPRQMVLIDYDERSPSTLLSFGREALKAIRRHRSDLVHLHSTFAGAVVRPMLGLMPKRPRIVYCPHGWAFGMDVSDRKKSIYAQCERLLAWKTDLIILNSDSERLLGQQFGISPGRMLTIQNGISSELPGPVRAEPLADGPVEAAFIGRFDRQKGLDLLLDAVEALPQNSLHLHLVGKGDVYGEGGPERVSRRDITLHGWITRSEIFSLLSKVDALIMPSRWEAQPIVALEAMRSGVAVIASNRPGLSEVVEHGVTGFLFDLDDPGALPRLLASLKRQQLRTMGEAAKRRFEAEFTAERMNNRLVRAYERVLGGLAPAESDTLQPTGSAEKDGQDGSDARGERDETHVA